MPCRAGCSVRLWAYGARRAGAIRLGGDVPAGLTELFGVSQGDTCAGERDGAVKGHHEGLVISILSQPPGGDSCQAAGLDCRLHERRGPLVPGMAEKESFVRKPFNVLIVLGSAAAVVLASGPLSARA